MEFENNISIVVPLFNEVESLSELHSWIKKVMDENKFTYEIILIDDNPSLIEKKYIHRI